MGEFRVAEGWQANLSGPSRDFLDRVAGDVLDDMRLGCPVDTGRLVESLDKELVDDTTARVGSKDVDYSVWVNEGHRIAYRQSAGVTVGDTRYVTYGDVVYTGGVVPPQDFMRPALYRERTY